MVSPNKTPLSGAKDVGLADDCTTAAHAGERDKCKRHTRRDSELILYLEIGRLLSPQLDVPDDGSIDDRRVLTGRYYGPVESREDT